MEKYPLRESLWRRGWNDTKAIWTGWRFYIWEVGGVAVMGENFGWYWGRVVAILGMVGVWIGATARALVKQRNEARELVEQQRKPSESEVTDAIRLLEAEKLVLKSEEEERSYSFSQVFLAIADHLSVGVLFEHLESSIKKGLSIDNGGWYFSYKDEGITHLIGVLNQNGLVDRCSKEYQRMTRDYPSDIDDITLGIINPTRNIFRPKPPQHLEKGTEVEYCLSFPLGARVVQQLRQQSVAHTQDRK